MLKYKEIIRRMSLEQKVGLVTSGELNLTNGSEEYDIPSINFSDVKNMNNIGVNECYPSLKALASTWDEKLIEYIGFNYVKEDNSIKKNKEVYRVPLNYNSWLDCFSEDPYLNGKFAGAYSKGVKEAGAILCLDKVPNLSDLSIKDYREEKLLPYEMLIKEVEPEAVMASSGALLSTIKKDFKYNNTLFVENESEDAAISFINGADFVFDQNAEAFKDLFNAVIRHKEAKLKLHKGEISEEQFEDYCLKNNAVDEKLLDVKIDNYLDLIRKLQPKTFTAKNTFSNDEIHELINKAAEESVILLKNNGILPFEAHKKIALIGEYVRNPEISLIKDDYYKDETLDLINKYINKTIGFAHGYLGDKRDGTLIASALELANQADVSLVYLGVKADSMENTLPEGQLELINALHQKGHKIVAVVSANRPIDMSFADKCEAVLFTRVSGHYQVKATLQALFGYLNPSGKLTETIPFELDGGNYKEYELLGKDVLYPFGHGLSYSMFEYSNLVINEHGVTFTIKNVGHMAGIETVQLYVGKNKTDLPRNVKNLRGFTRVTVKPGESIKVCIPFDEHTFTYYSENKEQWDIENGEYQIYIGSSSADIRLEANFDVYVKHPEDGNNVVIDKKASTKKSLKKFTYSDSKKDYYKDRIGISKPKKILITLLLMIFVDTVLGGIAYQNWIKGKSELLHYVLLGILGVFNLIAIIYMLVSLFRKSIKISKHPVDELTKMMSEVKEFKEIAKVVYEEPVEEVVEEEVIEEVEEEVEEEETVIEYSNAISYTTVDEKRTIKNVDLGRLCDRLCRYSASRGIVVDPKSARLILGSMAAGHLINVHSPADDLIEPFLDILGEFFGDEKFTLDASNRLDLHSILWDLNKATNTYELTDLSKVLLKAQALNKTMHTCTIKNVKFEEFSNAFAKILAFVDNPGANIKIKLNEEQSAKLGKNLWFFLITDEAIPEHIATSVLEINVSLRTAEEEVQFNEQTGISLPDFNDNVNAAKELFFISESNWKRIDEFVEHINELENFKIGNKQVLQMENFTSTYMAANADEVEALDMVFVSKLIPILKHTKTYLSVDGELKLIEYITRSFEEEALVQTQKILKSKN